MVDYSACIGKMKAVEGLEGLDDAMAKDILDQLANERRSMLGLGLQPTSQEFLGRIEKRVEAGHARAIIEKRNTILKAQALDTTMKFLDSYQDDSKGIEALLTGRHEHVQGARDSVSARQQALYNKYLKGMLSELDEKELLPHFQDGANQGNIAKEYFELTNENGKPGVTQNEYARQIAEIFSKYTDDVVYRQNNLGTWITDKSNYLLTDSHDIFKLRKAGLDNWKNETSKLLDLNKTFSDIPVSEWDKTLNQLYLELSTTGRQISKGELDAGSLVTAPKLSGLSKKASSNMTLKFKDANAWIKYNETFGSKNVGNTLLSSLEKASNNIALMEKLGPNPHAAFDSIMDTLRERNLGKYEQFDYLNNKQILAKGGVTPELLWKEVTGESRIMGNPTIANIAGGIRSLTNMASLGNVLFSQLPDIAFKASELRYHGKNPVSAHLQGFLDLPFMYKGQEKTRLARSLGAGFEGMISGLYGRLHAIDGTPGLWAESEKMFFKLTGMMQWTDAQKSGLARGLSALIAEHTDDAFADVEPRIKDIMAMYNIGESDWKGLGLAKREIAGQNYVTTDGIKALTDEQIRGLGHEETEKFRNDLESKWLGYIADRIDTGVTTPGPWERAMLLRGTRPGTLEGELLRALFQFRTFGLSTISRSMQQLGQQGIISGVVGVTQLAINGTLLAILGQAMKDVAHNKTPAPLTSLETWGNGFTKSGVTGLYGDYLAHDYSQYGQNLTEQIAGPSAAKLADIFKMVYKTGTLAVNPGSSSALKTKDVSTFLSKNTPFINLFYTRAALDYFMLYQLQESAEPGYINRIHTQLQNKGQDFIYQPEVH